MHGNIPYAERYDIQYELGSGGMGVVYKAKDKVLDKLVAIKLLKQKNDPGLVVRFHKEAKACGRLSHRNILTALDFGVTEEGDPYLVLDFVEGKTLGEILKEETRIAFQDALPIMLQLSSAMAYAHRQGILHRDLKPSNIMLAEENGRRVVKVLDFGIAKLNIGTDTPEKVSATGVIGSPKYMSPEQARGADLDGRSDIYSYGCTVFELLTGKVPHLGATALDTMQKKQNQKAPLLSDVFHTQCPKTLETMVDKCLARDPNDRFKSFDEISDGLIALIDSGEVAISENLAELKTEAIDDRKRAASPRNIAFVLLVSAILVLTVFGFVRRASEPIENSKVVSKLAGPHALADFSPEPSVVEDHDGVLISNVNAAWLKHADLESLKKYNWIRFYTSSLEGDALAPITGLKILTIHTVNSSVDDKTLEQISRLQNLRAVHILSNEITVTDAGLAHLKKKKLTAFGLVQKKITDKELAAVGTFEKLQNILITGRGYTAAGVAELQKIPLKRLELGPDVNADMALAISRMTKLKTLIFWSLQPGQLKLLIPHLATLPDLDMFGLSQCKLASDDLKEISLLKHLNLILLKRTVMADDHPLREICKHPRISQISLDSMNRLQSTEILMLGRKKGLKKLYLDGIFDDGKEIQNILRRECPNLEIHGARQI